MTDQPARKRTATAKALRRLRNFAMNAAAATERIYRGRELADAALANAAKIHTHMTPLELNTLYDLASGATETKRVLEVGSYVGASSCYLAAALSINGGHLYCVDTWSNETMPDGVRDTFVEFSRNTQPLAASITTIRKRSDEMTASDFPLPFDVIFIDADHSYPSVKGDFEKVRDWLKDDGTLAFHDAFFFEAVSRVVGEILATGQWQLLGKADNLVWLRKLGANGSFPNPMSDEERANIR